MDEGGWFDLFAYGPADLRETLVDSTRADLEEAWAALQAGDFARAASVAHRLKGIARLINAHEMIAACVALETQCGQGNTARSHAALRHIEGGLAILHRALQACRAAPPNPPFEADR